MGVYEWFERVVKEPSFKAVFGRVKIAPKGVKPQLKEGGADAGKKKQKQEQPKPKPKEEKAEEKPAKKDINPLEALPPSDWNFFDFKTLMHYDKYGNEGEVLYKTENLMKGYHKKVDRFGKPA